MNHKLKFYGCFAKDVCVLHFVLSLAKQLVAWTRAGSFLWRVQSSAPRSQTAFFFPSNLSSLNPNRISEFLCKLFLPRPSWYGRATESRRSYSLDVFVHAALVWVVHFLVENEVKVKNSSNSLLRFLTESAAGSHKHAATGQKLRLKAWKDIA